MVKKIKKYGLYTILYLFGTLISLNADVKVVYKVTTSGIMTMGMKMEGKQVVYLKSGLKRVDNVQKIQIKMPQIGISFKGFKFGQIGGGGLKVKETKSSTIYDANNGIYYMISSDGKIQKKTAKQMKEDLEKALEQVKQQRKKAKAGEVKIKNVEMNIEKIGTKNILNYTCQGYAFKLKLILEDLKEKKEYPVFYVMKLWYAPLSGKISILKNEEENFWNKWSKLSGIDEAMLTTQAIQFSMFYGIPEQELEKEIKKLMEEVKKIKGYPLAYHYLWQIGEVGEVTFIDTYMEAEKISTGRLSSDVFDANKVAEEIKE